MTGTQ